MVLYKIEDLFFVVIFYNQEIELTKQTKVKKYRSGDNMK